MRVPIGENFLKGWTRLRAHTMSFALRRFADAGSRHGAIEQHRLGRQCLPIRQGDAKLFDPLTRQHILDPVAIIAGLNPDGDALVRVQYQSFNNTLVFSGNLHTSISPNGRIVRVQSGASLNKSIIHVLNRHALGDADGSASFADLSTQFQLLVVALSKPPLYGLPGRTSRCDFEIINQGFDPYL